ncbi:MAG: TonB-dependent receptor [Crocinitomicaceae bacterium]|nr:TonB-dependent receptor [Crocinitomicaceae bacterium]
MKKIKLLLLGVMFAFNSFSQVTEIDSASLELLHEIIIFTKKSATDKQHVKPLTSIDDYLQQSGKIEMMKRGAYAWEPLLNSMATERTVVTIDGMRVFGACTDKMDPITSYVEISNLSEAVVNSGQQGAKHGSTIGGSIDLKRRKSDQSKLGWSGGLSAGFESNNLQRILGGSARYVDSSFYVSFDLMHRSADNYKAGGGREVDFSQFSKINTSASAGWLMNKQSSLEASVIYDYATNVGYPALTMDVSLAKALISSVKYEYHKDSSRIKHWETKIYYNTVTHVMDDTKRPSVPIHMDMPGWSDTYGMYSDLKLDFGKHDVTVNLNGFYNRSIAEMTMYPANSDEKLMFMYTWPDVRTLFSGIYLGDVWKLNKHTSLVLSGSIGVHHNSLPDTFGLQSLQIFYPTMTDQKTRLVKNLSAHYRFEKNTFNLDFGIGYGDRAPSVSEAYGFYLFNSFDRYDYVGDPNLKNEESYEASFSLAYKKNRFSAKVGGSYFHINNYIVGKVDPVLLPMTIGANGIKVYESLKYSTIVNSDLIVEYRFPYKINWKGQITYSYGRDYKNENLPFISPVRYVSSVNYYYKKFNGEIMVRGNLVQAQFNPEYGENRTSAWGILNASVNYNFELAKSRKLVAKAGVENILDAYYSTFSDWNNIPRMGRSVFVNLVYTF